MTNNGSYRAGIVGLGFIGGADQVSGDALGGQQVALLDGTHIDAFKNHARVQVAAGSTRDAGRRERFEQRNPGVKTYADWREMLAKEKLDIVGVATYADVHREITEACAAAGVKAVYCEKPITQRIADGEAMIEACRKAGTLLVVNHNRRFNPNYQKLRDLIAAGGIGDMTSASLRWGTGRLGNVGTHFIDALRMVTSRKVTAVSATLDRAGKPDCRGSAFADPGGWGVLRLEGGLMVTVDAADMGTGAPHITVFGTKGRATTAGDDVRVQWNDGKEEHWPSVRKEATSMDRAVREIVDVLDGKRKQTSHDPQEAVDVLEVLVAFHVSDAKKAAWVELPLKGEERSTPVRSG